MADHRRCGRPRFIPARAGRTPPAVPHTGLRQVHPCACRADSSCRPATPMSWGSSLRVQGGRARPAPDCPGRRFIPARAGRTGWPGSPHGRGWVHPCACRADEDVVERYKAGRGSSLRVQGGRSWPAAHQVPARFIPARAGRTSWPSGRLLPAGVHPCACRADACGGHAVCRHKGSSLRVQGGLEPAALLGPGSGFIPARAGRTPARTTPRARRTVHPCACRADPGNPVNIVHATGSSLRVQGGRAVTAHTHSAGGFIPARAGRT